MEELNCFLRNVEELKREKGIQSELFSKEVGINSRTMRRWREGRMPKADSLEKVAKYFNCSIEFLLGRTEVIDFYPSKNPSDFLTRYNLLKAEKNLKDIDISKKCKISTGTISKWKKGRIPDTEALISLCKIFDCSFDYLIGRSES